VTVIFAAQLASPSPEPILPGELRVHPGYASIYDGDTSEGVRRFRASTTFLERMHHLDLSVRKGAGWVIGLDPAPQMAALYSVQVGAPSRWLNPPLGPPDPSRGLAPTRFAVDRFVEQELTHVVVITSAEALPGLLDQLAALGFVLGGPVLDYVDDTVAPSMRVHVAPMSVRKGGTAGPPS
jgi:hypothetical protein